MVATEKDNDSYSVRHQYRGHYMTFMRAYGVATMGPCGRRERRREARGPRGPAPRGSDERFNRWLDDRLRRLYERQLSDPIPEDMLDLLEKMETAE